jgi:hypothetical protein
MLHAVIAFEHSHQMLNRIGRAFRKQFLSSQKVHFDISH